MDNNSHKCRIALDVMGGDKIPGIPIIGAIEAIKDFNDRVELFLVGDKEKILSFLSANSLNFPEQNIINAEEVVEMKESPTAALKNKPNSSINVALNLILDKKADAFVSAGNTGAVMAASTLKLGRIRGISRATIGTIVPTISGKTMLFDVGASVDCKPQWLFQYAVMGTIYMREIFGIKNPRVGLLNVGEEKTKGNELVLETYKLLEESDLNFVGNIEGRDVLTGNVEVIICDGFLGNVILKFAEGFLGFLKTKIKNYAELSFLNKLKALVVKYTMRDILKSFDYQQYGGVPLLGLKGITIIGHGSSTPLAIKNMIKRAYEVYEKNIPNIIENAMNDYLKRMKEINSDE